MKGRLSLDPELFRRSGDRPSRGRRRAAQHNALRDCVVVVHLQDASASSQVERSLRPLGATVERSAPGNHTHRVTHLITTADRVGNPDDDVIRHAVDSGAWVVSSQWAAECARVSGRALESSFLFDDLLGHLKRLEDCLHDASIERTTLAHLQNIQRVYKEDFSKATLYSHLGKRQGRRVLRLLASLMGEKTESTIRPQLTDVAKKSFELFDMFVRRDTGFQRAVEELSVTQLARTLKIERHLEDSDKDHQLLAIQTVLFISQNYQRFQDLRIHLRTETARQSVDLARPTDVEATQIVRPSIDATTLPPEGRYYDMEVAAVEKLFKTDFERGLTSQEAQERLQRYGANDLPQQPPARWYKILAVQFIDFLMIVMMVVGCVSFGLQKWIEGGVLWAVVIANALIGFVQEMKAEHQLNALKNMLVLGATVVRDGARTDVLASVLVPGDVVILQEGTAVPADMRLGEAQSLRILEAQLTGENEPIKKVTKALLEPGLKEGDQVNMAFMSTNVSVGDGKGIVVATGTKTAIGQISKNVSSAQPGPTKLQQKLKKLGILLLIVAVILCAIILAMSFIWMAARGYCTPLCPGPLTLDAIQTAVALAVSVIPEGLVAIFTVCMAMGASRMAAKGVIVRRLASVETLGGVTTVCSDKTGTLTLGEMKQETLWMLGDNGNFFITGEGIEPIGQFTSTETKQPIDKARIPRGIEHCMLVESLCNGSSVFQDEETKRWKYTGDPTEVALLVGAYKLDMGQPQLLESGGWKIVGRAPFDSNRKRMSVIVENPSKIPSPYRAMLLSKGAPEATLKACTHIMNVEGDVSKVTEESIAKCDHQSGYMADEGLRVLGLAFGYLTEEDMRRFNPEDDNTIQFEQNLTFVGLGGLLDPPRAPVAKAVGACHAAGIRVVMITGDHPRTALAIAKRLGIAVPTMQERQVVKGKELDAMSEEELAAIEPFPTVFARVSPEDKMKIVHALQYRGEVVSMTGDGVNDAPAIRHADVGVAMGITGTDLTKEAADIVLTDDNFTSIIRAVAEGRRIMDNIILFVVYLLSCNSGEIWTMLACVAGGLPSPFTTLQILWGNLIIDSPPSLALGAQPAAKNVLARLPRNPDQGIFTYKSALLMILQGLFLACLSVTLFVVEFVGFGYSVLNPNSDAYIQGLEHAQAHTFITISCMQLAQGFAGRSITQSVFRMNFFDNKFLIFGILLSFSLLVACMYIPGWNKVFDQSPMDGYDWIITLGMVCIHLSFVELVKYFLRHNCFRKPKKQEDPLEKKWFEG